MNKATLKINSFACRNTVLINDTPVAENSEVMNYYAKPIVQAADRILSSIQNEYNDNFELEVYGNCFETAFVSYVCSKKEFCIGCVQKETVINTSVEERIGLLKKHVAFSESLALNLVTNLNISLPHSEHITYTESSANSIVVSDNINFISANINSTVGIAFHVGGENRMLGATYVMGCTEADVQSMVNAYVESTFINPIINSMFVKLSVDQKRECILVNRVEPFYFVAQNFKVELNSETMIKIRSIPENSPMPHIICKKNNNNIEVIGNKIIAKSVGTSELRLYTDSPLPFAKKEVIVYHNVFAEKIEININGADNNLCEGNVYDVSLDVYPPDADDLAFVTIGTSDNNIAEIKDNKLIVKAPGSFSIIAKAKKTSSEKQYNSLAKIEGINVIGIPKQAYLGDSFNVTVAIHPEEVFKSGYKWITSDKTVAVVGVDHKGNEMVKTVGVGDATLKCVSVDDPDIFYKTEIKVESSFDKPKDKTFILYAALGATLLTIISAFFGANSIWVYVWGIIGVAASVLSISFEKNTKQKSTFCLVAIGASMIIHIVISILYVILS